MRAYWYDDKPGDQRLPHDSGDPISVSYLSALGVFYHQCDDIASVNEIASQRQYKNRDEITVSPTTMGAVYEDKVKMFFNEHMHEDEEIRYCLDGEGFFDVRAEDDARWVRIRLSKGDLIVLPAGIFHRFTTDEENYIKAMRLFKEDPKWTALNREEKLDSNPYRKEYVECRAKAVESS